MIKVFVMRSCPDCARVEKEIAQDPRFELIDIGQDVRNLKQFLALRDSNPIFSPIKERGAVGIPCFMKEDGTVTFSPSDFHLSDPQEETSCRLDGKGC